MGTVATAVDTYCLDSLISGRLVSGLELLGQRCYRRLSTPAGTLRGGEEEADFGRDLAEYVGSTSPAIVDAMLPVIARNELMKDPAVVTATCIPTRVEGGGQVSWTLAVSVQSTDGDLQLILSVSAVTVALLGVT